MLAAPPHLEAEIRARRERLVAATAWPRRPSRLRRRLGRALVTAGESLLAAETGPRPRGVVARAGG